MTFEDFGALHISDAESETTRPSVQNDASASDTIFAESELEYAAHILERLCKEFPRVQGKHMTNRPLGRLFVAVKRLHKRIAPEDKKNQKRELHRLMKNLDQKALSEAGIKKLREFRARHTQIIGGSMPVLVPGRGDAMGKIEYVSETKMLEPVPAENGETATAADSKMNPDGESEQGEDDIVEELSQAKEFGNKLFIAKKCHICHTEYRQVHHFYDQLCEECAELNFSKRLMEADFSGKIAIVTGGRVKIGYCVALKLLRCGASVIVTTRFPKDAASRYEFEQDYSEWKDRLHIYGLDFRDIPMVHHFCDYVKKNYPKLDFIINNAAQTVRKPPAFYEHLLRHEIEPIDEKMKGMVIDYHHYQPHDLHVLDGNQLSSKPGKKKSLLEAAMEPFDADTKEGPIEKLKQDPAAMCGSVLLSQVPLMEGDQVDEDSKKELFPPGLYDIDQQQLDLRKQNSWTMRLGEVSTVEMIECHAINAFAPFVINSELKCMLMPDVCVSEQDRKLRDRDGRYVVNVSAMEGQFYRHKTPFHPHTNMAKASMNMLTRTSAQDYVQDGIYMNTVDTGWITDEYPVGESKMHTDTQLDEWDAAMRILDPIFMGIQAPSQRHFGFFMKNYMPTKW